MGKKFTAYCGPWLNAVAMAKYKHVNREGFMPGIAAISVVTLLTAYGVTKLVHETDEALQTLEDGAVARHHFHHHRHNRRLAAPTHPIRQADEQDYKVTADTLRQIRDAAPFSLFRWPGDEYNKGRGSRQRNHMSTTSSTTSSSSGPTNSPTPEASTATTATCVAATKDGSAEEDEVNTLLYAAVYELF